LKNGKIAFIGLVAFQIVMAIAEGVLTYISTPDLSSLKNYFGHGWEAMLIMNILFIGVYIFIVYYAFVKYKRPVIESRTYKEFVSELFFKRPDKFNWTFYKLPKRWPPNFASAGYMLGIALPIARIPIVLELFLKEIQSPFASHYEKFCDMFPVRVDIMVILFVIIALSIYWPYKEWQLNQKILDSRESG